MSYGRSTPEWDRKNAHSRDEAVAAARGSRLPGFPRGSAARQTGAADNA